MQTVKIHTNPETKLTEIFVGDNKLNKVVSAKYHQSAEEFPCFDFETRGFPDIAIDNADIQFQFTPQTIQEATKVLRHSLTTDATLYDAFCASIESALKEAAPSDSIETVAKSIADRIIGEEQNEQ